jgi:uncharacterized membrane protein YecN with MAPEG domain
MNGNIVATFFAVLNILWILPLGYFMVMDIVRENFQKSS